MMISSQQPQLSACSLTSNIQRKVAFAVTGHKIQGQTVKKPQKVIVDLRSVFQPAMAYVMMSRVESIDQLYILEKFNESKI